VAETLGKPGEERSKLVQSEFPFDTIEETGSPERPTLSESSSVAVLSLLDACLDSLESVETDTKLEAAKALVESIRSSQPQSPTRVCVLTCFADTATYVASAFGELGLTVQKLTGAVSKDARWDSLQRFRDAGGVLVCTDVIPEGVDFPDVLDVLHYDLPQSPVLLEQRRGRFDRYGRVCPCTMYVFRDESGILIDEIQLFRSLMPDETPPEAPNPGEETAS
jgi:superfamily II DNA/RNA helicase